jgi:hypothetical protein
MQGTVEHLLPVWNIIMEKIGLESGCSVIYQAIPAVNRSSFGWLKWNFALFSAI